MVTGARKSFRYRQERLMAWPKRLEAESECSVEKVGGCIALTSNRIGLGVALKGFNLIHAIS
jgi:hypothetical protein